METERHAIPIADADLDALIDKAEKMLSTSNDHGDIEKVLTGLAPEESYRILPVELDLLYCIRHATCLYLWMSRWLFNNSGQKEEAEQSSGPTESIMKKQLFSSSYALYIMSSCLVSDCEEILKDKKVENPVSVNTEFRFEPGRSFTQDWQIIFSYYIETILSKQNGVSIIKNSTDIISISKDFWNAVKDRSLDLCKRTDATIQAFVLNATFKHDNRDNEFVISGFNIEHAVNKPVISFVQIQPDEIVGNTEAVTMLLRLCDRLALYDPIKKNNPLCEIGGIYESNLLDGPPGCITGDSKILLLDGTSIPIKNLESKSNFWVYSFDIENKYMVPGLVEGVAKTGYNIPIVEIEFESNSKLLGSYTSKIRCTLDHPFLLFTGKYRQAKDLQAGDSIQSIYIWPDKGFYKGYNIYTTGRGAQDKKLIHKQVTSIKYGRGTHKNEDTHHINENKLDNRPDNLIYLRSGMHISMHSKEYWKGEGGNLARERERNKFINLNKDKNIRVKQEVGKTKSGYYSKLSFKMIDYNKNNHPNLRQDITIEKLIELSINAKSMMHLAKLANCSRSKIRSTVLQAGYTESSFRTQFISGENHKVISVKLCGQEDVYDLSVAKWHNFAIDDGKGNGIFTHNTGKTSLTRMAMTRLNMRAEQIKMPVVFKSLEASSIKSEWYGKSSKLLSDIIKEVVNPNHLALLMVDDIDLLIGNRDEPGTGGADKDLLKGLMDFFSGIGTNYIGNYSSIAATNKATGVDDALRQRFVYRVEVTGAETSQDYADLVSLQLKKPVKFGIVNIKSGKYQPLSRPRIKTISNAKTTWSTGEWIDIGDFIMKLHKENPSFTARSVKNAMDVVISKAGDFEVPDTWFTHPDEFRSKPWNERVTLLRNLFKPITTEDIMENLQTQFNSEKRYNEVTYVNKVR